MVAAVASVAAVVVAAVAVAPVAMAPLVVAPVTPVAYISPCELILEGLSNSYIETDRVPYRIIICNLYVISQTVLDSWWNSLPISS